MTALGFYYKVHQPEVCFHCSILHFTFQDATMHTDYFNSPILFDTIGHAFFYNKGASGLTFPEHFNPIPVPALAFIFTVVSPQCLFASSALSNNILICRLNTV